MEVGCGNRRNVIIDECECAVELQEDGVGDVGWGSNANLKNDLKSPHKKKKARQRVSEKARVSVYVCERERCTEFMEALILLAKE